MADALQSLHGDAIAELALYPLGVSTDGDLRQLAGLYSEDLGEQLGALDLRSLFGDGILALTIPPLEDDTDEDRRHLLGLERTLVPIPTEEIEGASETLKSLHADGVDPLVLPPIVTVTSNPDLYQLAGFFRSLGGTSEEIPEVPEVPEVPGVPGVSSAPGVTPIEGWVFDEPEQSDWTFE
jgi:hypothetical protein